MPCVRSMSPDQRSCASTGSTDRPITLQWRLAKSGCSLARAPSSVGADRREGLGVGEEDRPIVADPIMEADGAFRRLRRKIRCDLSDTKHDDPCGPEGRPLLRGGDTITRRHDCQAGRFRRQQRHARAPPNPMSPSRMPPSRPWRPPSRTGRAANSEPISWRAGGRTAPGPTFEGGGLRLRFPNVVTGARAGLRGRDDQHGRRHGRR